MTNEEHINILESIKAENLNLDDEYTKNRYEALSAAISVLSQPQIPINGTNADAFHEVFGIYATELWAMPEKDFLEWLNTPYKGDI
jgi:hypothetical protein